MLTKVTLPTNFSLVSYQLTLQALEPLDLPPLKGSALRGGFGHTFKRLVCARQCDKHCVAGNECPYGYVFETAPPPGSEVLRNLSEVPRPFVIQTPADKRTLIPAGAMLMFGLTLIGGGIELLPYFVKVFHELGQTGLGVARGRYRLLTVQTQFPYTDASELIYHFDTELIRVPNLVITREIITAHAATLPTDRMTLNFLTPTRLKHQEDWVRQGPPFQALIKLLLGRVSSLSYFHCGQPFEADFRGLIDRAAKVQIEQSQTHWQDWSRFSGRQKQRVEMGGLVGEITYVGDLRDYLPLLALGELIHVGKGTVFGNGQYQIVGSTDVSR